MDKINCDIIRDLIPSYVDDVCSASTRRLVEEHIAGCGECRLAVTLCRDHALSGDKLELHSLDGLKKIKQKLKLLDLVSFCTLLLVIPLGIWLFAIRQNPPSESIQTALYLLCLFLNFIAGITHPGEKTPQKTQYLLGALSIVVDAGIILTLCLVLSQMNSEAEFIFRLKPEELGPFLLRWIAAGYILQTFCYLWHFLCATRQNITCNWLLCLSVMGMFLMLRYNETLFMMSDFSILMRDILSNTLFIVSMGLLSCLASFLMAKYLRRKTG